MHMSEGIGSGNLRGIMEVEVVGEEGSGENEKKRNQDGVKRNGLPWQSHNGFKLFRRHEGRRIDGFDGVLRRTRGDNGRARNGARRVGARTRTRGREVLQRGVFDPNLRLGEEGGGGSPVGVEGSEARKRHAAQGSRNGGARGIPNGPGRGVLEEGEGDARTEEGSGAGVEEVEFGRPVHHPIVRIRQLRCLVPQHYKVRIVKVIHIVYY